MGKTSDCKETRQTLTTGRQKRLLATQGFLPNDTINGFDRFCVQRHLGFEGRNQKSDSKLALITRYPLVPANRMCTHRTNGDPSFCSGPYRCMLTLCQEIESYATFGPGVRSDSLVKMFVNESTPIKEFAFNTYIRKNTFGKSKSSTPISFELVNDWRICRADLLGPQTLNCYF